MKFMFDLKFKVMSIVKTDSVFLLTRLTSKFSNFLRIVSNIYFVP